ncbi:16S rRNA (guanine(527)-N(7))-methyltransferase RsmG [Aliiroseovarius sp. CAU 1755]
MSAKSSDQLDVSRETMQRLEVYAALLTKWNPAINLVAHSTLPDLWSRHFVDSAQIYDLAPKNINMWCDMGAGGGFPGLVTAILAAEADPDRTTVCVESDLRKATFLRTVIRETGIRASVEAHRIESVAPLGADVVSARALAPLSDLLGYASRHLTENGVCLFLKGENFNKELDEALDHWRFELDTYPSKTNPSATILKIGDLTRA